MDKESEQTLDISPQINKWLVSKASEEMLNMISHQANANQTTMIPFHIHQHDYNKKDRSQHG